MQRPTKALLAALVVLLAAAGAAAGDGEKPAVRSWVERIGELAQRYPGEAALVAIIGLYLLSVLAGRKENLRVAQEFSDTFCGGEESLFGQQFAAHGVAGQDTGRDPLWWREGPQSFKIWATGRRFCTGALIAIETPPRHDMIKRLIPGQSEGRVDVEVIMREGVMAPMVLAVGPPKAIRALGKSNKDVKDFTKKVELPKDRFPLWPAGAGGGKELAAVAESQALFADVFGDARVQQLIGRDPLVAKHLKQIVFTTEGSLGPPDRKLKFTMALPGPGKVEELRGLLTLAFLMIDIVGSYKHSADAAAKAAAVRQRVAAVRGADGGDGDGGGAGAKDREAAAQLRRLEKLAEEREKARRQGPKALEKFEERIRKQQLKKAMKRNTVKMG
ncbi:MAG: hypothetical protein J3K34DRAFT_525007 [Monoraphidium minutum]|nr:MAG: hypothetical protein J3K34DRAFT_525007 [Monoraphidium minutum]